LSAPNTLLALYLAVETMLFFITVSGQQLEDVQLHMEVECEALEEVQLQKGRKRVRHEMSWKKNIRKSKSAKGEQYISTTGETIDAKTFNPVDCCCPLKCSTKIDAVRQAELHSQFYALAD